MKLELDAKKFLSLPLNNGMPYIDRDGVCGCIKGNFARSSNVIPEQMLTNSIIADYLNSMAKHRAPGNIYDFEDKTLSKILHRAEKMLLAPVKSIRPQYIKLFVVRALRMLKQIPQENSIKEQLCQTV